MNKEIGSNSLKWADVENQLSAYEVGKYDVETKNIRFVSASEGGIKCLVDGVEHDISQDGKLQILGRLSPSGSSYLKKCPDELLAINLNHWVQEKYHTQGRSSMLRCRQFEDGTRVVRGLVSKQFAKLDHKRILGEIEEKYADRYEPRNLFLNDDRMVLRLADKEKMDMGQIQRGDYVGGGVDIYNSEIGNGAVRMNAITYRVLCTNGMVSPHAVQERGKAHRGSDLSMEAFLENAATQVRGAADRMVNATAKSREQLITNPSEVIGFLAAELGWADHFFADVQKSHADQVAEIGAPSKYALMQAITENAKRERQAQRLRYETDAASVLFWDHEALQAQADDWARKELEKSLAREAKRGSRLRL